MTAHAVVQIDQEAFFAHISNTRQSLAYTVACKVHFRLQVYRIVFYLKATPSRY